MGASLLTREARTISGEIWTASCGSLLLTVSFTISSTICRLFNVASIAAPLKAGRSHWREPICCVSSPQINQGRPDVARVQPGLTKARRGGGDIATVFRLYVYGTSCAEHAHVFRPALFSARFGQHS
ncbi:hypothetical protein ACTGJ9_026755 [Bradyrhizobium sp. RDM12]